MYIILYKYEPTDEPTVLTDLTTGELWSFPRVQDALDYAITNASWFVFDWRIADVRQVWENAGPLKVVGGQQISGVE